MTQSSPLVTPFRGGIFHKLFIGLWIGLLGLGLSVWLLSAHYQQIPHNYGAIEQGRPAVRAVSSAIGMLRWGGRSALIEWLKDKESNIRPTVFVVDQNGQEISGRKIPEKALAQLSNPPEDAYIRIIGQGRGPGHRRHHRMMLGSDETLQFFAVRTDLPPRNLFSAFWHTPLWLHIVLAILATTAIAGFLAWNISRPIRKLDWAMRRATQGDLDIRIGNTVGHDLDEIGVLAKRYDKLLDTISGLLARQKTLFHDVSHELRSPLARIGISIALAQKNPDRSQEILSRIEREVNVLDGLVGALLTYARLDDNAPMQFEKIDLVAVLEGIVEDADFEGSAKKVRVVLSVAPAEIPFVMHIDSFASAVENLVRNALRFSPPETVVSVEARQSRENIVITVSDEGPGIAEEDLERLFQPFMRGSDQATGSGFGLGLAIAKRAVQRHGGTLTASNRTPHGLCMCITLPVEKSAATNCD